MHKVSRSHWIRRSAALLALAIVSMVQLPAKAQGTSPAPNVQSAPVQIHALKITLLSTMLVGSTTGLGEWGFSALIEADGHRVLLDTGAHPDTVLQNARDLKIDLSDVREVILTHNHWDHVSGLMTLRKEMMKKNPSALSVVHIARGIFYSRPAPEGEDNKMIALKKEYEATGGKFVEHTESAEVFPGAWLTGPVPRKYPERNLERQRKSANPSGLGRGHNPGRSIAGAQHAGWVSRGHWLRARGNHQHSHVCPAGISQRAS